MESDLVMSCLHITAPTVCDILAEIWSFQSLNIRRMQDLAFRERSQCLLTNDVRREAQAGNIIAVRRPSVIEC
jgi:hypothetical protein